jgi:hypothetical protein
MAVSRWIMGRRSISSSVTIGVLAYQEMEWLADFWERVLMPGGSLLCSIGGLNSWMDIASVLARDCPQPLLAMKLTQPITLKGVFIRFEKRNVLWFSKWARWRFDENVRCPT